MSNIEIRMNFKCRIAELGRTRAARVASWMMLALACTASAGIHLGAAAVREPLLDAFGWIGSLDKLPAPTKLALTPAFAWTVLLVAVAALGKEFVVRDRFVTLVINATLVVLAFLFAAVAAAALFLPAVRIICVME